jgi:hypothetical protein
MASKGKKSDLVLIPGWNIRAEIFTPFLAGLPSSYNCHLLTPPPVKKNEPAAYQKACAFFLDYFKKNNITTPILAGLWVQLHYISHSCQYKGILINYLRFSRNTQKSTLLLSNDFIRA